MVKLLYLLVFASLFGCTSQSEDQNPSESKSISKSDKKVLFIVTNHDEIPGLDKKTGAFFGEIAHPYLVLSEAGIQVDFVSPKGGTVPLDGLDAMDEETKALYTDDAFMNKLMSSKKPSDININDYAAVYYAGGHGAMFDLPNNKAIQDLTAKMYEKGGAVGAVCHGPAGLVNVKLSSGKYLVDGKTVSSFTNAEEEAVKLVEAMPFLLETKLKERGGKFEQAPTFQKKVVVSERLVTGQNPASAKEVGEQLKTLVLNQ